MKDKINITKIIVAIFLLVTLQGCASMGLYNPATGKKEFVAVSTQQELSMGKSVHKRLSQGIKFSNDVKMDERLQRIGNRVALVSDRQDYQYKFFLVEDDSLNAFTTPGGNIYFHTGLMKRLENDDQIAFVIAHEIGHCAARHVAKKYQAALGYDLIGSIILGYVTEEGSARSIASLSSSVLSSLVFSAYSRKDENQADVLGVKYAYLAGYDPEEGAKTFYILREHAKGSTKTHLLSSHPDLLDRIENVGRESSRVKAEYSRFVD